MDYHAPGDVVHQAAERLIKNFDKLVAEFKQEHVKIALKSLPNITKQFNSSPLIGMLEAKKRIELHEQLEPSSSTLLVVPNPLLQHWEV